MVTGTFSDGPLQQVVFGLQLGDAITALQKLPEFLRREESKLHWWLLAVRRAGP